MNFVWCLKVLKISFAYIFISTITTCEVEANKASSDLEALTLPDDVSISKSTTKEMKNNLYSKMIYTF